MQLPSESRSDPPIPRVALPSVCPSVLSLGIVKPERKIALEEEERGLAKSDTSRPVGRVGFALPRTDIQFGGWIAKPLARVSPLAWPVFFPFPPSCPSVIL